MLSMSKINVYDDALTYNRTQHNLLVYVPWRRRPFRQYQAFPLPGAMGNPVEHIGYFEG